MNQVCFCSSPRPPSLEHNHTCMTQAEDHVWQNSHDMTFSVFNSICQTISQALSEMLSVHLPMFIFVSILHSNASPSHQPTARLNTTTQQQCVRRHVVLRLFKIHSPYPVVRLYLMGHVDGICLVRKEHLIFKYWTSYKVCREITTCWSPETSLRRQRLEQESTTWMSSGRLYAPSKVRFSKVPHQDYNVFLARVHESKPL